MRFWPLVARLEEDIRTEASSATASAAISALKSL